MKHKADVCHQLLSPLDGFVHTDSVFDAGYLRSIFLGRLSRLPWRWLASAYTRAWSTPVECTARDTHPISIRKARFPHMTRSPVSVPDRFDPNPIWRLHGSQLSRIKSFVTCVQRASYPRSVTMPQT